MQTDKQRTDFGMKIMYPFSEEKSEYKNYLTLNSFAAKFLGKRTSQCQIYFG